MTATLISMAIIAALLLTGAGTVRFAAFRLRGAATLQWAEDIRGRAPALSADTTAAVTSGAFRRVVAQALEAEPEVDSAAVAPAVVAAVFTAAVVEGVGRFAVNRRFTG